MENKSNNYSGYPITYERELPFDKSGSQFVNELPKKHDRTTAMATICYALGVITDSPSKDHLTDECDPIRFGLLYELTKSEDSKPEDSGSKWMKIYPEVEDLYRTIIIAQDELSPNARQRETRGVLEQRTFAKLTEKLEQKLLTSEPLDYVDYHVVKHHTAILVVQQLRTQEFVERGFRLTANAADECLTVPERLIFLCHIPHHAFHAAA